jgi:hypothetical protein
MHLMLFLRIIIELTYPLDTTNCRNFPLTHAGYWKLCVLPSAGKIINKMASAVPHAALRKLCQGVLCRLDIVHFHVTRMNVIM